MPKRRSAVPNPAEARPPERRAGLFRRKRKAPASAGPATSPAPNRLEAAAWFGLALAIVAWGRAAAAAPPKPPPPQPFWRRLVSHLVGMAPETPEREVRQIAASQPGRGRDARSPREIPKAGWRDIAWRTWTEFNKDRVTAVAGGVTFFSLLAVFPALAAFVSLYGLFFDVASAREQLDLLAGLLPRDALAFVGDQMIRIASGKASGLGIAFVVSLALSLWSANAGVKALIDGLNIAYEERERRGLIRLNLVSLAFTFGGLVFIIGVLGLVVALPVALSILGYTGPNPMAILRWPLLLGIIVLVFQLLYRYGPSRERARWRWVSWGAIAAAVLWLIASMLFSWYVANFAHYDKTYGSLGAVVGFMTWMWISTSVVLLGAELNAEIEHQTAVDSTTGTPQPMGKRGAKMADTLGETSAAAKPKPPNDPSMADPRATRAGAGKRRPS